jgi:hypothetical protein
MQFRLICLLCLFFVSSTAFSQRLDSLDVRARHRADTSGFSPNERGRWFIYNSYLAPLGKDSAIIEVVIRHDKNIDWNQFQLIGRIKERRFVPKDQQVIRFLLVLDGYQLKIDIEGRCFVRLDSGQLPAQDPVILPFRVNYRKN